MISSNAFVLLKNFTKKPIGELQVGDQLIDADLNVCNVTYIKTADYQNKLRILSFNFDDLFCFTEASTFLARKNNVITYWVENPAVLIFQINYLKINSSTINDTNKIVAHHDAEFATIRGFKRQHIIDITEKYLDQSTLFLTKIETDSFAPIIVNDFFYIPVINDTKYNYHNPDQYKLLNFNEQ
jgi:hypothetical protein